jgi:hypothetical protein
MATDRLSLSDKSRLEHTFTSTLSRSLNNKPFPINKEDILEFGIKCLPEDVGEHYAWLYNHDRKLVSYSSWRPEISITVEHPTKPDMMMMRNYKIPIDGSLPRDPTICPESHPRFKEVLEWAEWYAGQSDQVRKATYYIEELVHACTSVGQIKRVLPPEVMSFIPEWMRKNFNQAIRKSRIPRAWAVNDYNTPELEEIFMQTLALGAISIEAPEFVASCRYTDKTYTK